MVNPRHPAQPESAKPPAQPESAKPPAQLTRRRGFETRRGPSVAERVRLALEAGMAPAAVADHVGCNPLYAKQVANSLQADRTESAATAREHRHMAEASAELARRVNALRAKTPMRRPGPA